MEGLFDSAWLKWGWAVRHAEVLQSSIASYRGEAEGGRIYTTETEYDAKRHCIILRVATLESIPDEWSLMLGDTLHGYRSCLDHVAWAIYKRGKTPSLNRTREKKVSFPVRESAAQLGDAFRTAIPGIRRADEAIVRRFQPYRVSPSRRQYHVFGILVERSNFDKHRAIEPLFAVPGDGWAEVANPRDCSISRIPVQHRRVPLHVGAELHRVYVRRLGPNPRLDMYAYIAPFVALDKEVTVHEWLTHARSFSYQLLSAFQAPPTDRLRSVGIMLGRKGGQPAVEVIH